jgi:hypothetical protein
MRSKVILVFAFLASPAIAGDYARVTDRGAFVNLVGGKSLTSLGVSLTVSPSGSISGRAFGSTVSGAWTWSNGYFCRTLKAGSKVFACSRATANWCNKTATAYDLPPTKVLAKPLICAFGDGPLCCIRIIRRNIGKRPLYFIPLLHCFFSSSFTKDLGQSLAQLRVRSHELLQASQMILTIFWALFARFQNTLGTVFAFHLYVDRRV